MTKEQAEKLMQLHLAGYVVQVDSVYVDSPVDEIYKENDEIVFDSGVYSYARLIEFGIAQIKVSKPLDDWLNEPIAHLK